MASVVIGKGQGQRIAYVDAIGSDGSPVSIQANTLVDQSGNPAILAANLDLGGAAISPANPLPIYDAFSAPVAVTWSTATAVNTAAIFATSGYDTAIVTLLTSASFAGGIVVFEVYDGLNWIPVKAPTISDYTTTGLTITPTASFTQGYQVPVAGFPQFRVRLASILTAGTINVTGIISSAPDVSIVTVGLDPGATNPVTGNVAAGGADSGNPIKVGAVYNSALPSLAAGQRGNLQLDSYGNLLVLSKANISAGSDAVGNGALTTPMSFGAPNADGSLRPSAVAPFTFNGSSWDRERKPSSVARLLSAAATTNATSVKISSGDLFKVTLRNNAASARFLKIYNKSSAPIVGTDTPLITEYIAAGASIILDFSKGFYFSAGIAFALTINATDSDTTALTAGDIVNLQFYYQ